MNATNYENPVHVYIINYHKSILTTLFMASFESNYRASLINDWYVLCIIKRHCVRQFSYIITILRLI